tara:strand:+ start:234 stop:404 length:171 start_codon:yes stop_codon:yes gene_type:complete
MNAKKQLLVLSFICISSNIIFSSITKKRTQTHFNLNSKPIIHSHGGGCGRVEEQNP